MNWKIHKTLNTSQEDWKEVHELNDHTILTIKKYKADRKKQNKGYLYAISSSRKLYTTLRSYPITPSDIYRYNDIATDTEERAYEILNELKETAEKLSSDDTMIVYLEFDSIERFENDETVFAQFHPTEGCQPYEVKVDQISQWFLNNPGGYLRKRKWSIEEEAEFAELVM